MSCYGCQIPLGNFAREDQTWTNQSSLNMSNFDPYPELQRSGNYQTATGSNSNRSIECYNPNNAIPYSNLNQTWSPQKNYSL